MAFASKIGNVLKRTVSSNLSLFQPIRCMSSSKLFVGGLSYGTDDTSLREAFSHCGEVIEARVIVDRDSGRSRGFGFITYTSGEEASAAITAMDGKDLHGRMIRVNYANDRAGGFRGGHIGGGGYGPYGNRGGGYSNVGGPAATGYYGGAEGYNDATNTNGGDGPGGNYNAGGGWSYDGGSSGRSTVSSDGGDFTVADGSSHGKFVGNATGAGRFGGNEVVDNDGDHGHFGGHDAGAGGFGGSRNVDTGGHHGMFNG